MNLQGLMGGLKRSVSTILHLQCGQRRWAISAWAALSLLLIVLAVTISPVRTGDGEYYFAMLDGLARNGSPVITEAVREMVRQRIGVDPVGLTVEGTNGRLYGVHFFAYPLLCLPSYKLLNLFGADGFRAFQLTNALIVALALGYVLILSHLSPASRWLVAAGFLFSTGTIYFQWTHPELLTAALVLSASVAVVERRHVVAILMAAVGSLQNPSAALMIVVIVGDQILNLRSSGISLISRRAVFALSASLAVSLIAILPFAWNFVQFGMPSPIAARYLDYSSIGFNRLFSFLFDLNQGLIVGLPLLLWVVPMALALRMRRGYLDARQLYQREDLLLVGFLLMVLPTLSQVNWNAGHSVFLRYAAWTGMAPLVWVAVTIGREGNCALVASIPPALALQFGMMLSVGGILYQRFPHHVQFMPWVLQIWRHAPHVYDPLPEIFYERLVGREEAIKTPAVLRGPASEMLRVLTSKKRIADVSVELCASGGVLVPLDSRRDSLPRMRKTERGYSYLTGRMVCGWSLPVVLSLARNAIVTPLKKWGWSDPELTGTWSSGPHARLVIKLKSPPTGKLVIRFVGHAFVNNRHTEQTVHIAIGERSVETWVIEHPKATVDKMLIVDAKSLSRDGELVINFEFPSSSSPSQLGLSKDGRKLALFLREVSVTQFQESDAKAR